MARTTSSCAGSPHFVTSTPHPVSLATHPARWDPRGSEPDQGGRGWCKREARSVVVSPLVHPDGAFGCCLRACVVVWVCKAHRGHPGLGGEGGGVSSLQGSPLLGCTGLRWE